MSGSPNSPIVCPDWRRRSTNRAGRSCPFEIVLFHTIRPGPTVALNPRDLERLGVAPGGWVKLTSRRGELTARARTDPDTPEGVAFLPFAFREAAANLLTNPALDPFGKIAELKYCAVKVEKA
ncbi:MAG: hypothetical protein HQL36_09255 [Alphaproteobacteria bacterium]|nr:hypothetical protein [Alphaproteobacteria bacterium]